MEQANIEGGNLNTDVFVADKQDRGDLVLFALEFGEGKNSATAKLAVLEAEWGALILSDSFSSFSAQAMRLASKWDRIPDKLPSQHRDVGKFINP